MIEYLICESCQFVHPTYYDGPTCRSPGCNGKLKLVRIAEKEEEKEDKYYPISEKEHPRDGK